MLQSNYSRVFVHNFYSYYTYKKKLYEITKACKDVIDKEGFPSIYKQINI